jgi:PTH1 family peptidyl-tRNA hydrolase
MGGVCGASAVKLLIGLGNPGREYEETKHNVGFWVVEAVARAHSVRLSNRCAEASVGKGHIGGVEVWIAKPQTYMNLSGRSVLKLMQQTGATLGDLIVVYDDLDLPCGTLRIRQAGRSGGHRGVASIIQSLSSEQFIRLKIGIGREAGREAKEDVLSLFSPEARQAVEEGVQKAVEAIPLLLEGRITEAMNRYHPRLGPAQTS